LSAPLLALVLAAGEGTRMKSKTPKVLHEVLGRPLLGHVLHAVSGLSPTAVCVVTGAGRETVENWLHHTHPQVLTTVQAERKGTGHATKVALTDLAKRGLDVSGLVIVLTGDTPLLTSETLSALLADHRASGSSATVLTAELFDPTGYGRVIRAADGLLSKIVEHKDATEEELNVAEINSGIYVFDAPALIDSLAKITTNNAQGEEYLTEVLEIQIKAGNKVSAFVAELESEVMGVNDRWQLSVASTIMQDRINLAWMHAGVTIEDLDTTWIGAEVVIASDVLIRPNTHLEGSTAIASDAVIGPDTTLVDCAVMQGAHVVKSHALESVIGESAKVGPFSYLRPGTQLGSNAKAGAFVEIKNSIVGAGSKVPHLSYVGDAEIGINSNIGAATVFVNYDGQTKHRTVIGNEVRIGSDTMLVAPVEVGDGAYTAAGSVITVNVPAGSLGVARVKQSNILGWVLNKRSGSAAAAAAKKSLEENDSTTEMEKP
jgi:bifunctional UDP-N-acetylglucosamine pyrophosphorylase / glucosamine-1-phosphate N-acetyltransferase